MQFHVHFTLYTYSLPISRLFLPCTVVFLILPFQKKYSVPSAFTDILRGAEYVSNSRLRSVSAVRRALSEKKTFKITEIILSGALPEIFAAYAQSTNPEGLNAYT